MILEKTVILTFSTVPQKELEAVAVPYSFMPLLSPVMVAVVAAVRFLCSNAYKLCKNHTSLTVPTIKAFRIDLAKALIGEYCSRKRIGRPSVIPPAQRFCEDHFYTCAHYAGII